MRKTLGTFLLLAAMAAPASADETGNVVATAPAPPHHGFYLRISTGFGSHVDSINQRGADPGVTLVGMSSVGEFGVGWSVKPRLVIGLGTYGSTVFASHETSDATGPMPPPEIRGDVKGFSVTGPFVDWYFNARRGLHGQLAIGVASVRGIGLATGHVNTKDVVTGAGFVLGFGNDWSVSEKWSLGILARMSFGVATTEDEAGMTWEHGVGATPSVLFTGAYY
jgi:hypothetical protein